MTKNPLSNAVLAAGYIALIVSGVNATAGLKVHDTILIPMLMLSLFVVSAAIMGLFFVYQPVLLLLENKRQEALVFFGKTLGYFVCFGIILGLVILFTGRA